MNLKRLYRLIKHLVLGARINGERIDVNAEIVDGVQLNVIDVLTGDERIKKTVILLGQTLSIDATRRAVRELLIRNDGDGEVTLLIR